MAVNDIDGRHVVSYLDQTHEFEEEQQEARTDR